MATRTRGGAARDGATPSDGAADGADPAARAGRPRRPRSDANGVDADGPPPHRPARAPAAVAAPPGAAAAATADEPATEAAAEPRPRRPTGPPPPPPRARRRPAARRAVTILPGSPYGRIVRKEIDFVGRRFSVETGKLAGQAGGSVSCSTGTRSSWPRPRCPSPPARGSTSSPSPWTTRSACTPAGKIPGGYPRRETRPRDEAVLMGRLDRPAHPAPVPQGDAQRRPGGDHHPVLRPGERSRHRWPSSAPRAP